MTKSFDDEYTCVTSVSKKNCWNQLQGLSRVKFSNLENLTKINTKPKWTQSLTFQTHNKPKPKVKRYSLKDEIKTRKTEYYREPFGIYDIYEDWEIKRLSVAQDSYFERYLFLSGN